MKNRKTIFKILVFSILIFSFCENNYVDPAVDGPGCDLTLSFMCVDLIPDDAGSISGFQSSCITSGGNFISQGCDFTVYDIAGHCDTSWAGYNSALWYSSSYFTSQSAEVYCGFYTAGTWVP